MTIILQQVSLPSYSSGSHVSTGSQNEFHDAPDPESSHGHEPFLSPLESKIIILQPISTSEVCSYSS